MEARVEKGSEREREREGRAERKGDWLGSLCSSPPFVVLFFSLVPLFVHPSISVAPPLVCATT